VLFRSALFAEVIKALRGNGSGNVCVVGGGSIRDEDKPGLERIGVTGNFGPGTPMQVAIDHIVQRVRKERWLEA